MTDERIRTSTIICHLLIGLFLVSNCAISAQELKSIAFTRFNTALVFGWEGVSEEETSIDGTTTLDFSEQHFETGLEFRLAGYSYHPNLLEFTAEGLLLYEKSQVDEVDTTREFSDTNPNYNVNLLFFKQKPISAVLHFSSDRESSERAFLGRYYNQNRRREFRLNSRYRWLPFELKISQIQHIYSSILLDRFDERDISTTNVELRSRFQVGKRNRVELSFTHLDYEEENYDTAYQNTRFLGLWSADLGTAYALMLDNMLLYSDFSGTADQRMLTVRTKLGAVLPHNLRADSSLALSENKVGAESNSLVSLDANLSHQLFRSLYSRAGFYARSYDQGDQKRDILGQELGLNYRKMIPTGDIRIGMSHHYSQQENSGVGESSLRIEEDTFDLADTIMISAVGIDPSSIVITAPDLSAYYLQDVDYTVILLSNAILITRIPGGNIPSFATIRISYDFQAAPNYHLNAHDYANEISLRFLKVFSAVYRIRASRNSVDSVFTVVPYESYKSKKWEWGFNWKNITFRQSREDYDGNLSQHKTDSYLGSFHFSLGSRLQLQYSVSGIRTEFWQINHFTDLQNQNVTASWVFHSGLTGSVSYWLLSYEDEIAGARDRESLICRLNWRIRKLQLTATYEYLLQDTYGTERERSYYNISLRRRF